ncbi:glycoside hydrolase family 30 protein [Fictibacillus phosphorivorans]|uniref:glycoside hydrolase family 30 protein n=1 Tax=Fictibacillus phosphorivorans TaxID=1221500 RepID=UPI00203B39D8|nr:glycoside hydrolase family 30 beta sandwich domain-containing protein [Fictibacillus phosphorivorans]MCM3717733.1 glycosyl hydrolase [Fictibacillus phosphorivorans]MCM3775633.1 glycosyl hydrolase [Fictibacillus phosphorivorans]
MKNLTIYQSNGEHELFVQKDLQQIESNLSASESTVITINEDQTYQEIDGFGASFTDSAAFLIHSVLDEKQQTELMEKLFHPEKGIGLSVLRNPMGASDYAREMYSYNDLPEGETDFSLEHFTIAHDLEDIVPLVKEALRLNPDIKLMASPWSAPAWMKTSSSMIGGELKEDCYRVYADYFVKYIQSYGEHGLPIYGVTPQNEPLYVPGHYPGMLMEAERQADFIKNYLKPRFMENGIDTKILCYDHNWDRPDYPLFVIDDVGDAVDGVAWHWYGGKPVAQHQVHRAYPEKEVHFTEGSGGEWIPAFEPAFSNVMRTGIEIMRNDSKSFVLWNMALDEENGPTVPGFGRSTCRGVVTVEQKTKKLTYTLDYYALAHFSKFVGPKAVRIESTSTDVIRTVAFKNTDESTVTVLFNDSEETQSVQLKQKDDELLHVQMDPKSAMTLVKI